MPSITLDRRNLMMIRYNHYKTTMNKHPIILRSPFTGEIIFVQRPLKEIIESKDRS